MTDAESKSTNSASESLEDVVSQPALVAISEENLAALMRATGNNAEPEPQPRAEYPQPLLPTPPTDTSDVEANQILPVEEAKPGPAPFHATLPPAAPPIELDTKHYKHPLATRSEPTTPQAGPRNRIVVGSILGGLLALVGLSTFLIRTHSAKAPQTAALPPKDNFPLQVQIEPLGNGLINVRWNPQSTAIAQAREGRLVITADDHPPQVLALAADQLKIGHLTYQSPAERIEFNLEVVDRSGSTVKESILALSSPISSPTETIPPPREQSAVLDRKSIPVSAAIPRAPEPLQPKVRTFAPPTTERTPEQRAVLDAPPPVANGPIVAPGADIPVSLTTISPPPSAGKEAAPQQVLVESSLQAANLIKKVLPIYPPFAKSNGIQGTVRFTALIGKDGRIQNLKVISGTPLLVDSASAAVKQWVYRPTLLNGEPVEVLTQIDVGFNLNGVTFGSAKPLDQGVPRLPAATPPPPTPLAPAGTGATEQPVRVEGKVQAANLIKKVSPIYPPLAKTAGLQGTVRFTALIGKDGRIQNLKALSGMSLLVDAASAAVKQWVYRPTLLNGVPVEVLTQIDVTFNLNGDVR